MHLDAMPADLFAVDQTFAPRPLCNQRAVTARLRTAMLGALKSRTRSRASADGQGFGRGTSGESPRNQLLSADWTSAQSVIKIALPQLIHLRG